MNKIEIFNIYDNNERYYYIYIDKVNIFKVYILNIKFNNINIILNIINILKKFNILYDINNYNILNYLDEIYSCCDIYDYNNLKDNDIIKDYIIYLDENIL